MADLHYIKKIDIILPTMWVGELKNRKKYAYVIKVWPLSRFLKKVISYVSLELVKSDKKGPKK